MIIHFGKYKDTDIDDCSDIQFLTWYYNTYQEELPIKSIKLLKSRIGILVTIEAKKRKSNSVKTNKILYLSTNISFGKYKGRLVNDIIKHDLSYFKWLISVWEGKLDWKVQDIVSRM